MTVHHKQKGFTIIETIIYIALFSILLSGGFVTAFQLLQGSDVLAGKSTVQSEGNFVLEKISWAMSGVKSIDYPTSLPDSDKLRIVRHDGIQVDICLDGTKIRMQEVGIGSLISCNLLLYTITSDNVSVSNLKFHYIPQTGSSLAGITVNMTINGKDFTATKYIRK